MTDDPEALRILLSRCMGTLEGLVSVYKMTPEHEKKVASLLLDIEKATGLKVKERTAP